MSPRPPLEPRAILMVCLGNICRSPTAEGVLRHRLHASGLGASVRVDSAGTHAGAVGMAPDPRSVAHAARRGYDLRDLRARRMHADDFHSFGLILAMDEENWQHMRATCPPARQSHVARLMDFAPPGWPKAIPDPYYGSGVGFERALDLIEIACDGLIEYLQFLQGEQSVQQR